MEQGIWSQEYITALRITSRLTEDEVHVLKVMLVAAVDIHGPRDPLILAELATKDTDFSLLDAMWILDEMVRESNREIQWEQLTLF